MRDLEAIADRVEIEALGRVPSNVDYLVPS
jgi:hypothetical protein